MNETPPVQRQRTSVLLSVLVGVAVLLTVALPTVGFLWLKSEQPVAQAAHVAAAVEATPPAIVAETPPTVPEPPVLPAADAVSIRLGEDESGHGLTLVKERDGHTEIESIDGVAARVMRLAGGRTEQYFYFRIDDAFKQEDVRRVRIDVEYLDPQPGTLFIHYDALDAANRSNPAYRYATPTVRLAGSGAWQHAAFHTRYDAAFDGRQNGHSDFRLRAKTPILYVPVLPVGNNKGKTGLTGTTYADGFGWQYDQTTGAFKANCADSENDGQGNFFHTF